MHRSMVAGKHRQLTAALWLLCKRCMEAQRALRHMPELLWAHAAERCIPHCILHFLPQYADKG